MEKLKSLAFIATFLLIVGSVILTMIGGGDGVWELRGLQVVQRSHEHVFALLTEPQRRKGWVDGLAESTLEPAEDMAKGSRLREVLFVGGDRRERVLEITEYEPGTLLAFRVIDDGAELDARYELQNHETGEQSRIDYQYKVRFPGFLGRVLEPIRGQRLRSSIHADLERLAALSEATAEDR